MTTAYGYLRVSTESQRDSGLGLEAQEQAITVAAARLGLTLSAIYRDEGVSGTVALEERPGLLEAIRVLKKGDTLLVAKRDRLGRDVLLVAMLARLVERKGARIVSAAGEGTDDDGPTSVLMRQIIDAFAQYERAMIASRTRAALKAKLSRGERAGTIRFGWQLGADKKLEPNPREQTTLAVLRQCRARGDSYQTTAHELNAQGLLTRSGALWCPQYVRSLERRHGI